MEGSEECVSTLLPNFVGVQKPNAPGIIHVPAPPASASPEQRSQVRTHDRYTGSVQWGHAATAATPPPSTPPITNTFVTCHLTTPLAYSPNKPQHQPSSHQHHHPRHPPTTTPAHMLQGVPPPPRNRNGTRRGVRLTLRLLLLPPAPRLRPPESSSSSDSLAPLRRSLPSQPSGVPAAALCGIETLLRRGASCCVACGGSLACLAGPP